MPQAVPNRRRANADALRLYREALASGQRDAAEAATRTEQEIADYEKPSSLLKGALAASLMAISSGCATTAPRAQTAAGECVSAVAADVTMEPQPAECGQGFVLLPIDPSNEAQAVIKRYDAHVEGPINGRIARCYRFNEDQRTGLVAR